MADKLGHPLVDPAILDEPIEAKPPRLPRWLSDMRPLHAAILMVAIWAGTFIAIWRLKP